MRFHNEQVITMTKQAELRKSILRGRRFMPVVGGSESSPYRGADRNQGKGGQPPPEPAFFKAICR